MSDFYSGTIYSIPFSATALTTTGPSDLIGLTAPSNSRVRIVEIDLGQSSTAPGVIEQLSISLLRGSTGISGGTAITPVNLKGWTGTPVAGSSATGPSTTLASSASMTLIHADAFDQSGGWCYDPDDGDEIWLEKSQRLHLRVTAPSAAITVSGTMKIEETGQRPA